MPHMLPIEQLDRYRHLFLGPHLELVLDSIAVGNTAALLWEVPFADGALVLLWDKGNNVFYIAGEDHPPIAKQQLAALISEQIRPLACAERAIAFKTRALSAALERDLPQIFSGMALHPYPTRFYTYEAATPPAVARPTLPELTILPIDRALLRRDGLTNRDDVRAEIDWMWPSEEHFYARGFGTLALLHDQIICWCTAEYVGPTRCGIGITTIQAYERQGVATATAAAFVHAAQQRGLTACWECGSANRGSIRVAEKLGFEYQAEESYWTGSFASIDCAVQ